METILKVAENLLLAVDRECWQCGHCGRDLGDARVNVKRHLLVAERDPREIHPPLIEGEFSFAPNPEWVRILEFYCPGCATQIETEYLPPGHPITHTTALDLDSLKRRLAAGELRIEDGHLRVVTP